MVEKIKTHHPLGWFAGRDHITGSIGPFLKTRMREEEAYCAIYELPDTKDKQAKAQPIQGRMAQKRVHFPVFAPWWTAASEQLLGFPNFGEDDFVDALANIGRGMAMHVTAERKSTPNTGLPKPGTLAWVKGENDKTALAERSAKARKGW
jgi:hypothetical protein